jgi:hypothetical protein
LCSAVACLSGGLAGLAGAIEGLGVISRAFFESFVAINCFCCHCERSEAIQLRRKKQKSWIASSQELLAMTL